MRSKAWRGLSRLWCNAVRIGAAAAFLSLLFAGPARAAAPTTGPIINEYAIPTANSGPAGITAGPDGNVWFTESHANKIGQITPKGKVTEFAIPTRDSVPAGITAGPDGNLWFTELGASQIGRVTPLGGVREHPVPPDDRLGPRGITAGPDGNLWFTVGLARAGRITPGGDVTEFAVPQADNGLADIVAGPDGNLWLSGGDPQILTRVSSAGTTVTSLTLKDRCDCQPPGLTVGPDGNLWFSGRSGPSRTDGLGRIVPATGAVTLFATHTHFWSVCCAPTALGGVTSGLDGNVWFTEGGANQIGQLRLGP